MSIAAVVLAAGFSRRLGQPKQRAVVGGRTLLARAISTALEAGCAPVLVVVQDGDFAAAVETLGTRAVLNHEAAEGMAASVRAGIGALGEAIDGAVLMTCDQVGLTAEHLRALAAEPNAVKASAYGGRKGVPAYFPASAFAVLQELHGDQGARELLRAASAVTDERLALDVDTAADLALARELYG